MDVVLLDALLEQQANGNRIDGTFTTSAYNNVLKICREELKYPFEKYHLKNRIKTLKINFNACYDLFKGLSGFSWSLVTRIFEVEPKVWNTLIESKPNAKKWRVTKIQNYDKLLELFTKDRANGEGATSAKEKVKQWEKEGLLKRKASIVEAFDKQVEMIQSSMNNVADAIREGNVLIEKGILVFEKTRPCLYEEQDIYAELLKIGIPDNIQLEAFLFLVKSPLKTRAFFAVPSPRRYEFLLNMMHLTNENLS
ncbi:hypothetical protein UlMin_020699 [Ulmus minor]